MTGPGRPTLGKSGHRAPVHSDCLAAWAPTAGRSHMSKSSVIPTGTEPLDFARGRLREAQRRDLFCCSDYEEVPRLRRPGRLRSG